MPKRKAKNTERPRLTKSAKNNLAIVGALGERIAAISGVLSSAGCQLQQKHERITTDRGRGDRREATALDNSGNLYRAALDCERAIEDLQALTKDLRSYSDEPSWRDDDDDDDGPDPVLPQPSPQGLCA